MSDWIEMHALADGQLEGSTKAEAEAKRDASASLAAEFQAVQTLKGALSRVDSVTSAETWQKCRSRLDELDKRERVEGFVGRYAWGLCSLIFFVMLAGAVLNRLGGDRLRTGDVAKVLSGFASSGARQDQSRGVEMRNWIKPASGDTLTLTGTESAIVNGYVGTVYRLVDGKGRLAYITVRGVTRIEGVEPMLEDRTFSAGKINNTNCVTWHSGADAHFLVAERSYEDLVKAANRLRE